MHTEKDLQDIEQHIQDESRKLARTGLTSEQRQAIRATIKRYEVIYQEMRAELLKQ